MNTKMKKNYTELIQIDDYLERFEYLKLHGAVGIETFGGNRYLNQIFYSSPEWKAFRRQIIIRDKGCDMAFDGLDISGDRIIVHHINPITIDDVLKRSPALFDPENAISVSDITHKAIHYGSAALLPMLAPIERAPNDTCPWR